MDLKTIVSNKYNQVKQSLRVALFSKNKSLIRISEFSKKSTFKKIITFTTVNLFVTLPYMVWFAFMGKSIYSIPFLIASFTFTLLFSNALFFLGAKIISTIFNWLRKKPATQPSLLINPPPEEQIKPVYFENTFMGKIKEFFVAAGSVATSFLPFIVLTNIILLSYYFGSYNYLNLDLSFFTTPLNYLKADGATLIFLTSLTTGSIYSLRFLAFMRRVLIRSLKANKGEKYEAPIQESENYQPKRIIPMEEFLPTLSKEFNKEHGINISEEIKSYQEVKK